MADVQIKSGDCVQLKHGGGNIKMTVDFLFVYQGRQRANCKWFNEKDNKFEDLSVDIGAIKSCDEAK
jgi:uncharacterized protein YodC (DUF2158 family)